MAARPKEEAALDPWVELTVLQERQKVMRLEADIENERRDDELFAAKAADKHNRAISRHKWYGYVGVSAVIVAGILGFVFLIQNKMSNGSQDRIRSEEIRTEQVIACTSLTEPIERQFCLLSLGLNEGEATT